MNCCDEYGDCRQGRDCPVRVQRVAKIGRKDYARAPLPAHAWRRQLRTLAKWVLIVLVVMTVTPAVLSVALAKEPGSKCGELLAKKSVAAHVRIKCKISA